MMAARLRWFSAAVGEYPPPPDEYLHRYFPWARLPSYRSTRKTWAVHEAGHVVANMVVGLPVESAHVDEGDTGGIVHLDPDILGDDPPRSGPTDVSPKMLQGVSRGLSVGLVAGIMAELLFLGAPSPTGNLLIGFEDWHDFEKARTFMAKAYHHTSGVFWCQEMALHILSTNWPFVLAVAEGLLVNGELRKAEIAALAYRYAGIGRDPKLIKGGCYEQADA